MNSGDSLLNSVLQALALAVSASFLQACDTTTSSLGRRFETSFESASEFDDFYIEPQDHMGTASHDLSTEKVHSGTYSHKGWIYGENPPSTVVVNNNHRGYPTIQFYELPGGAFRTPCRIELWVWLDATLATGEWFSFATLSADASKDWTRVVLINLSDQGFVHLMHVPNQGEGNRTFQTTTKTFPMQQWVKLEIEIDFDADHGEASVWQDGELVSQALVNGGHGTLEQAHFGLYAPPSLSAGTIYNDDLLVEELP